MHMILKISIKKVADPGEGPGPPSLFFDLTEAQRAEIFCGEDAGVFRRTLI